MAGARVLRLVNSLPDDRAVYVFLLDYDPAQRTGRSERVGMILPAADRANPYYETHAVGSELYMLPDEPSHEFYIHARTNVYPDPPDEGRTWGSEKQFTIDLLSHSPLDALQPPDNPSGLARVLDGPHHEISVRGNKVPRMSKGSVRTITFE